jgi:hypothetical protein
MPTNRLATETETVRGLPEVCAVPRRAWRADRTRQVLAAVVERMELQHLKGIAACRRVFT